mmetsp:Transcript_50543/g.117351  ORF Transcript_50543/g.117351 Transcript_50543/m.117351 type:complete len:223 (+) Transcript_50543:385-1053(+)
MAITRSCNSVSWRHRAACTFASCRSSIWASFVARLASSSVGLASAAARSLASSFTCLSERQNSCFMLDTSALCNTISQPKSPTRRFFSLTASSSLPTAASSPAITCRSLSTLCFTASNSLRRLATSLRRWCRSLSICVRSSMTSSTTLPRSLPSFRKSWRLSALANLAPSEHSALVTTGAGSRSDSRLGSSGTMVSKGLSLISNLSRRTMQSITVMLGTQRM